ncbi:hypothetical protein OAG71_03205 [bacterium]|nr:hypothetical protein [bacterium]
MPISKTIYSEPAAYRFQWALTTAFALGLLLVSICSVALGQSPELDPPSISIIDATDQASSATSVETFSTELLNAELTQSISPTSSFQPTLCDCSAGPQSIELRKNVLGCTACYTVPSSDEIWIVSVRANTCDPDNVDLFEVKKFANNNWQASSLNALTETHRCDKSRSTLLYVHGNQTNYEYGVARGFQFYDNLFIKPDCPRPPVRLVLWLWESERTLPRLYPDYLFKSKRAVEMGRTLTKTLDLALGPK